MKTKLISIILTFIFCLTLISALAACNGNGEKESDSSTGTEKESSTREEETLPPPMEEADADDLSYVPIGDDAYSVLGLFSEVGAKKIIIPAEYNGLPVTAISECAFQSSDALESIVIPDSVTHIGNYAFDGCSNLSDIDISKNLSFIGMGVFDGCDSIPLTTYENGLYIGDEESPYVIFVSATNTEIESCTVHKDTRIIYDGAFFDCSEIDEIILPDTLSQFGCAINDGCYDLFPNNPHNGAYYLGSEENPFLVLVSISGNPESLEIHEDTKFISPYAFEGCTALASIALPQGLQFIGEYAFEDCSSLKSVSFPESEWRVINGEAISVPLFIDSSDEDISSRLTEVYYYCTWMRK